MSQIYVIPVHADGSEGERVLIEFSTPSRYIHLLRELRRRYNCYDIKFIASHVTHYADVSEPLESFGGWIRVKCGDGAVHAKTSTSSTPAMNGVAHVSSSTTAAAAAAAADSGDGDDSAWIVRAVWGGADDDVERVRAALLTHAGLIAHEVAVEEHGERGRCFALGGEPFASADTKMFLVNARGDRLQPDSVDAAVFDGSVGESLLDMCERRAKQRVPRFRGDQGDGARMLALIRELKQQFDDHIDQLMRKNAEEMAASRKNSRVEPRQRPQQAQEAEPEKTKEGEPKKAKTKTKEEDHHHHHHHHHHRHKKGRKDSDGKQSDGEAGNGAKVKKVKKKTKAKK